jgi:hypothetical protein
MKNIRTECVICGSTDINEFMTFKEMPVYMGVSEDKKFIYDDMIFNSCTNCKNIQLGKVLDPDIVYAHNHNIEIVGDLWTNHYLEFIDFINDKINEKTILEIGDPSAKIAKLTDVYNKWIIVEKNPNLDSTDKIEFKKDFFDDRFEIDSKIDVIIHSHLLEHIYEPFNFFKKCRDILEDSGDIFFSVPNMKNCHQIYLQLQNDQVKYSLSKLKKYTMMH